MTTETFECGYIGPHKEEKQNIKYGQEKEVEYGVKINGNVEIKATIGAFSHYIEIVKLEANKGFSHSEYKKLLFESVINDFTIVCRRLGVSADRLVYEYLPGEEEELCQIEGVTKNPCLLRLSYSPFSRK